MRIYVAGPLNDGAVGYIKNAHRMMSVAIEIKRRGHAPYVPCLDVLLGFLAGNWNYHDYADMNLEYVEVCDALFMIASSPGTDKEVERAKELGIPVFTKLSEVPMMRRKIVR